MKRFMGMMPSTEIKKESRFKDKTHSKIIIQAGENGWTVLYADGSSQYKDITQDVDKNFKEAYEIANSALGELIKL